MSAWELVLERIGSGHESARGGWYLHDLGSSCDAPDAEAVFRLRPATSAHDRARMALAQLEAALQEMTLAPAIGEPEGRTLFELVKYHVGTVRKIVDVQELADRRGEGR